jgi:1,5-anhydro-D-fructose reductase (1,5-anhydro-D-mannitol-forming)
MRFAVVGLGNAVTMFHLPALRRVESAELVGGFDLSAERRGWWEGETGTPAAASLDELFDRTRPEAVIVATPPGAHVEGCLRALEAGCHVFCEKPLAESSADADRILAAADAAGRLVSVNLEFREHPIFRAVRDGVASGAYGALAFCQVWQLLDLPPWDEPASWRAGMADRALLEGGIHLVDLIVSIFGEQVVSVSARHSAGFHDDPDADALQLVTLEFAGGRLGQVTQNRLSRAAMRYLEVRADCERASLRASFGGRANARVGLKRAERAGLQLELGLAGLAWAERGARRTTLARNPRDAGIAGAARLLDGLVRAARDGGEPPSSGAEARHVLAVIEAAYESARTGAVTAPA